MIQTGIPYGAPKSLVIDRMLSEPNQPWMETMLRRAFDRAVANDSAGIMAVYGGRQAPRRADPGAVRRARRHLQSLATDRDARVAAACLSLMAAARQVEDEKKVWPGLWRR